MRSHHFIIEKELVTPPLDGLILPGVTRLSLLELAREWKEFNVVERTITMKEVIQAHEEERVIIGLFLLSNNFTKSTFHFSYWRFLERGQRVLYVR